MIVKFVLFIILIYGFLFLGWGLKRAFPKWEELSKPLTRFLLLYSAPLIILNAFWSVELNNIRYISLPLINTGIQLLALVPAFLISGLMRLNRAEKGSFVSCSMFSNTGFTLGGFLCLILYGERGLYMSSWYITLFLPVYYLLGFPLMSAITKEGRPHLREALLELMKNPISVVPIAVMCAGISLNLAGIAKPRVLTLVTTRYLPYLTIAGYSLAIGLGLSVLRSIRYIKHSLFVSLIKFVYNPMMSMLLLTLFGYLRMTDTLPSKVVLIESFMPTAIMGLVLAKVFSLNEDLSNAAWFVTTFLVIPLIPVMFYLQSLL